MQTGAETEQMGRERPRLERRLGMVSGMVPAPTPQKLKSWGCCVQGPPIFFPAKSETWENARSQADSKESTYSSNQAPGNAALPESPGAQGTGNKSGSLGMPPTSEGEPRGRVARPGRARPPGARLAPLLSWLARRQVWFRACLSGPTGMRP